MKDTILFILVIFTTFMVIPVAILWTRDRITNKLPSPEKIAEDSRRFRERLTNPDYATVESHFNHSIPPALKALYQNHADLLDSDIEVIPPGTTQEVEYWYIGYFVPLDAEQLRFPWPGRESYLEFADDGTGNAYMIDPKQDDPPVLFHDHDNGKIEQVSKSLSEFLSWPRVAAKDPDNDPAV